ncbi:MAG: dTDP-4-dehydrorhamnose reductase [Vicinamibacterales bacterium]|jgi:dTDP-4-dehydrorhamnose reductase|nr:dTDP-4-dehydrorhamnose reductase [Vicinamibacterales bacterium]
MRQRVLVTGASGQLAGAISAVFSRDADVTPLDRAALDITDDRAVNDAVAAHRPDVVVNCAACNDVDGAESDPLRALDVNAFAVRGLARASAAAGATLVHYSSDFVFDGTASRPYTEDDRPNPQGVYAASKLLGEWFAAEAGRALVLRVESLFGAPDGWAGRKGSLGTLIAGIDAGREVPVFIDRTVTPSYILDVAEATRALVASGTASGLYHCVNTGACSWHDIALEIARLLGKPADLRPITLESVTLPARRPRYCALDNARLRAAGISMPAWQDALARYLASGLA